MAASKFSSVPEAVRMTTSHSGAASRRRGSAERPSRPGMRRSSRTRSGCVSAAAAIASSPSAAIPASSKPCERSSAASASRVRGWSSTTRTRAAIAFLIGSSPSADKTHMKRQRTELQAWLWGEVVLAGLLAASLALLLTHPTLRAQYDRPELLLVLETAMALAGILVALLAGARFSVTGLRTDLLLAAGFLIWSLSTVAFAIIPALNGGSLDRADAWAALAGGIAGQGLIAT